MNSQFGHIYGHYSDKVLEIHKINNIYNSNRFTNGISIKASRINHSCQPNAAYICIEGQNQIGAILDIKKGEEITISYHDEYDYGMRKSEYRQANLFMGWYFLCSCDLCNNGPEKSDDLLEAMIDDAKETVLFSLINWYCGANWTTVFASMTMLI